MAFHEFAHVEFDERFFAAEEEFGEDFGQFRFADAGWSQEDEAADGSFGIFEAGAGAADGFADGLDGFVLADDAFVELVFHAEEAFAFFAAHAVDGHAGPHGDDFGDVVGGDDGLVGDLAPAFAQFFQF